MRSGAGSADGRVIAGAITLGVVLIGAFIAALIVSGVLAGNGGSGVDIAIADDTQVLDPVDPESDGAGGNDVTESTTPEPAETFAPMYESGDSGDGVRGLQARLKQIQWYRADVTGEFDDVTLQAVEGFQAKRGLEPTGDVDDVTWAKLVEMTHTPTEDEMRNRLVAGPAILGPGDEGDGVRELQARLKQIGWFEHEVTGSYGSITVIAVGGFQAKRGFAATGEVDQNTWDALVGMTREPTDGELDNQPTEPPATDTGLPEECMAGRVLCIDRGERVLRWVTDGDVDLTLDVRFGSDPSPAREGTFEVYWKWRKYESDGTEMPYALIFDSGQAVHYSADFDENGYNGSDDGSVNVGDEDAMKGLYDEVHPGDDVFVYRSS